MRNLYVAVCVVIGLITAGAQVHKSHHANDPSQEFPFGKVHPDAPEQVMEFGSLIGMYDCRSVQRNPDQNWGDTTMLEWRFSFVLNGMAIQDETWHENGWYATSIRQFHPDSAVWVVGYSSSRGVTTTPGVWLGGKEGDDIVLRMPQRSPGQGIPGMSRLTFYDITDRGFRWKGEWVDSAGTIVYPFWMIDAVKRGQ